MGNLFSKRKGTSITEVPEISDKSEDSSSKNPPPKNNSNGFFKKTDTVIFDIFKYFFLFIFIGLFCYWFYLIFSVYTSPLNTDDPKNPFSLKALFDASLSNTIFHAMVLLFFLYFVLITKNGFKTN